MNFDEMSQFEIDNWVSDYHVELFEITSVVGDFYSTFALPNITNQRDLVNFVGTNCHTMVRHAARNRDADVLVDVVKVNEITVTPDNREIIVYYPQGYLDNDYYTKRFFVEKGTKEYAYFVISLFNGEITYKTYMGTLLKKDGFGRFINKHVEIARTSHMSTVHNELDFLRDAEAISRTSGLEVIKLVTDKKYGFKKFYEDHLNFYKNMVALHGLMMLTLQWYTSKNYRRSHIAKRIKTMFDAYAMSSMNDMIIYNQYKPFLETPNPATAIGFVNSFIFDNVYDPEDPMFDEVRDIVDGINDIVANARNYGEIYEKLVDIYLVILEKWPWPEEQDQEDSKEAQRMLESMGQDAIPDVGKIGQQEKPESEKGEMPFEISAKDLEGSESAEQNSEEMMAVSNRMGHEEKERQNNSNMREFVEHNDKGNIKIQHSDINDGNFYRWSKSKYPYMEPDQRYVALGHFIRDSRAPKANKGMAREQGYLNKSRLYRIGYDNKIMYKREFKRIKRNKPQVISVIDISGSTSCEFYDKIHNQDIALYNIQGRAGLGAHYGLTEAGIPNSWFAHTTGYNDGYYTTQIYHIAASHEMPIGMFDATGNMIGRMPGHFTNPIPSFNAIDLLNHAGNHDGDVMLEMMNWFSDTYDGKRILIMISDGAPAGSSATEDRLGVTNNTYEYTAAAADYLRSAGIAVYSISTVDSVVEDNNRIYGEKYNIDGSKDLNVEFMKLLEDIV